MLSTGEHPLATLESVSLTYETSVERIIALDRVTESLCAGELLAVTGASGSGKTTLINVIAGLQVPDSGEITVTGHRLDSLTERQRAAVRLKYIGVVFQDHNLIPEFTAEENVALPLRAWGMSRVSAKDEADRVLDAVGLSGVSERRPAELSGGQRQRVGIARALAGGKRVLLADEPTGSLDATNSRDVFDLLRQLAETGVGVLVASHDPMIHGVATRTLHMEDGRASAVVGPRGL